MNTICHWELQTTDPKKAKAFYEPLFGWKVAYIEEMNYIMIETGGQPNGGINVVKSIQASGTLIYVLVDDIDGALEKVKKLGGKVISAKSPIPNIGFYGILQDTDGNSIGLFTPKK